MRIRRQSRIRGVGIGVEVVAECHANTLVHPHGIRDRMLVISSNLAFFRSAAVQTRETWRIRALALLRKQTNALIWSGVERSSHYYIVSIYIFEANASPRMRVFCVPINKEQGIINELLVVLFYQRDMEFPVMYSSQSLRIVYAADDDDDDDAKTNEPREISKQAMAACLSTAWNGQTLRF